uniref:Cytochrome c oxidase subunit 3 n=1 Tax=Ruizia karukerae TaxID=2201929 RepID=A0A343YNA8_9BILA|nr:cytochrome c oxidase subunit III [Ruizia karukerae]
MLYHNFCVYGTSIYSFGIFMTLLWFVTSLVMMMKTGLYYLFVLSILLLLTISFMWFKDVSVESFYFYNMYVIKGMKYGFLWFIFTETLLFGGIFWTYFDAMIVPGSKIGTGTLVNPFGIPLMNTIILLMSGVMVTISHYEFLLGIPSLLSLLFTIILSLWFLLLQMYEYYEAGFSISDGIYGSLFYMSTGFHGLHVMAGMSFLSVNLLRFCVNHFDYSHHFGYIVSILYWHFVDVVWLFLFIFVYWWPC